MTTWTPASSGSETWTTQSAGQHAFSTLGFSHVRTGGLRAFSMKSASGNRETWDAVSPNTETWTTVA